MSFEAAWGFDPDKTTQPNCSTPSETETDRSTYSEEEQRAADTLYDMHSQIYMSSAECIGCDAAFEKFRTPAHRRTPLGGRFTSPVS